MLSNLTGWHALIILGVLGTMALVVLAIVILAIRATRRRQATDPAVRLQELDRLRARGLVTEAEYTAKRQEILGLL
jgi:uncharacterized membrane protein